ncbi:DNA repair protein rhp54 [Hordeum vulgare]|nr:DNA repair protein rhp54 [Hordeum vulgare]
MMLSESPHASCTHPIPGFHVYPQGNRFSGECSLEVSIVAPSSPAPVTIDLNVAPVARLSSSVGMRKREREMPVDMLIYARNLFHGMPAAVDDDRANRFLENMIFEGWQCMPAVSIVLTRTSVPWSDVHLPNVWHLSADRVPIPPVPTSGRARRDEIERRRRLLPDDLYYDDKYVADSTLWDTWLRDEHDVRRASYFVGTASGPRRLREVRGRTRVRGLTPTPSPSPSPSPHPPPRMTEEEEARLMQRVMEDSMMTHDEHQWPGLDCAMALFAAGDVAIPEQMEEEEVTAFPRDLVGEQWSWSCTAPEMAQAVGA